MSQGESHRRVRFRPRSHGRLRWNRSRRSLLYSNQITTSSRRGTLPVCGPLLPAKSSVCSAVPCLLGQAEKCSMGKDEDVEVPRPHLLQADCWAAAPSRSLLYPARFAPRSPHDDCARYSTRCRGQALLPEITLALRKCSWLIGA